MGLLMRRQGKKKKLNRGRGVRHSSPRTRAFDKLARECQACVRHNQRTDETKKLLE